MTDENTNQKQKEFDPRLLAAIAAHEANRAYCIFLGDDSQVPWAEAPDWQKKSCVAGVLGIHQNPDITPAQQHAMWMAQKNSEGWTYGVEKDETKKTHPCMVPYHDLPEAQRFKDSLFSAVVRAILEAAK